MQSPLASARSRRAIAVFAVPAICTAMCTVPIVVALAGPPSAVPSGAHIPSSSLFTSLPGEHVGRAIALASAKPVPASWPHPEPMTTAANPAPANPARASQHLTGGTQAPAVPALESTNWSGYIDSGSKAKFTGVSGTWTVPSVKPGPAGYSSSWVGIDGNTTTDLIQAGTEQDWGPDGVVYYAWYEILPASAMYLGAVFPGDEISVQLAHAGTASWTVTVDDVTQHTIWSGAVSYSAPGTSAEWIEEAPTNSQTFKIYPLADFGTVQFSDLEVAGTGTATATAAPIYMVARNGGPVQAHPGNYDPVTDSFGIDYGPSAVPGATPAVPIAHAPAPPTTTAPATTTTTTTTTTSTPSPPPQGAPGYWLVGLDGGVFAFGSARYHGSAAAIFAGSKIPPPVIGIAPVSGGGGYWLVTRTGGVFPFGDAGYFGSLASMNDATQPIIGIVPAAGGKGYYMVGMDGGVYAFGDARFEGSCDGIGGCGAPVVALVPDATGDGYWLELSNCTMVPFGNAPSITDANCKSYASAKKLVAVSAARTPDARGYWVLLDNGTVFPEGDAGTLGSWWSAAATVKEDLAVALLPTSSGQGAWIVVANGAVEALGDAPALGGVSDIKLNQAILSAAST